MTTTTTPASEVWFLTGSQGLYGPETLDQVASQSKEIVARLDGSAELPVRVVWKPVLLDAGSIHRQMLEANSAPECVGVITWMHTFSPAKMWIAGLDALQKPLLHLHTQAGMELPWSTIDMDFMNLNQAAHGDREFGYIQSRLGVPRKTVAGHVDSPTVVSRIAAWARAAVGRDELRHLRLARFGDNMRDVAVTEGDKVEAQLRFGVSVNTYGVNDLVAVVDRIADSTVDALVAEYEDTYDVAAELRRGGPRLEAGPLRRQHAQRRGDRGRQGGGPAAVRRLGQHLRRQRPRRRRGPGGRRRHRQAGDGVRRHLPGLARAAPER